MLGRMKPVGMAVALCIFSAGVAAYPGSAAQSQSAPTAVLTTKITKLYPWMQVKFTPASVDQKQFNLGIYYPFNKQIDLADAAGARLMDLYITVLKGQNHYLLTAYAVSPQVGITTNWQYKYFSQTKQLVRFHFISATRNSTTTWYLTPVQVHQAAMSGRWPRGVTS